MKVFKCCFNCSYAMKVAVPAKVYPEYGIFESRIEELKAFNKVKRFCGNSYNNRVYNAYEKRGCHGFDKRNLCIDEQYYCPEK